MNPKRPRDFRPPAAFSLIFGLALFSAPAAEPAPFSTPVTEWLVAAGAGEGEADRAPDGGLPSDDGGAWFFVRSGAGGGFVDLLRETEIRGLGRPERVAAHVYVRARESVVASLVVESSAPLAVFADGADAARIGASSAAAPARAVVPIALEKNRWHRLHFFVRTARPGTARLAARIDATAETEARAARPVEAPGAGRPLGPRAPSRLFLRRRAAAASPFADAAGSVFLAVPLELDAAGDAARSRVEIEVRGPDGALFAAPFGPAGAVACAGEPGERVPVDAPVPLREALLAAIHGRSLTVVAHAGSDTATIDVPAPSPRAALAAFFSPAVLPRGVGGDETFAPDRLISAFPLRLRCETSPPEGGDAERVEVPLGSVLAPDGRVVRPGGSSARAWIRPSDPAAERHLEDADLALALHGFPPEEMERLERDAVAALVAGDTEAFSLAIESASATLAAASGASARRVRIVLATLPSRSRAAKEETFDERIERERKRLEEALAESARMRRAVSSVGSASTIAAIAARYPDLAADVRSAAAQNRIELLSGSFTDLDSAALAAAGGESLARQFLLGQKTHLETLGATARIALVPPLGPEETETPLPEALPQILAQSGIECLLLARGAEDLARWESRDGAAVLVARPPVFEEEGSGDDPYRIARAGMAFAERTGLDVAIVLGRFGPRSDRPVSRVLPRIERAPAAAYVAAVRASVAVREDAGDPSPIGTRRGEIDGATRASFARRPQESLFGDRLEPDLVAAETFATIALSFSRPEPARHAAEAWRELLLARSLGGDEGRRRMRLAGDLAEAARREALAAILAEADTRDSGRGLRVAVLNPLAFSRRDLVALDVPESSLPLGDAPLAFVDAAGASGPVESGPSRDGRREIRFVVEAPATGFSIVRIGPSTEAEKESARPAHGRGPESVFLGDAEIRIDAETGSLFRRSASGSWAEILRVEPSGPRRPERIETRSSPVTAEAEAAWRSGAGLSARLVRGARRVDLEFRTGAAGAALVVPVSTYGRTEAVAGSPFGSRLLLPDGTSGAAAALAHRFLTVPAGGESLSILVDRAAPATLGAREVRIDVPPRSGIRCGIVSSAAAPRDALVERAAAAAATPLVGTVPPRAATGEGVLPPIHSFFAVEPENVVVSAVKPAEDGSAGGAVVVRLAECAFRRTTARLVFPGPAGFATPVDLLERDAGCPVAAEGGVLEVELPPGGVRTFRIEGIPFGPPAR